MVSPVPSEHLQKLTSKEAFQQFQKSAIDRWTRMWDGDDTVISVGDTAPLPSPIEDQMSRLRAAFC